MADEKISELDAADDLDAADLFVIVKGADNFKLTGTQLATFLRTAASGLGSGYVLQQSGVAVSHTGDTNETTLATATLPAGAMGVNGQVIIEATYAFTGTNSKTPRVKFGGTVVAGLAVTTSLSGNFRTRIANRNAANSQVWMPPGLSTHFGITSVTVSTSAIDTASAVTILFTGQLTNTGETISLQSYQIRVFPAA